MQELVPNDYARVKPVFQPMDEHLGIRALLDGAQRGHVFVDDVERPRAALAWSNYRFYLAGSPGDEPFNEAVQRLFAERIYPEALERGAEMFLVYYAPGEWEPAIESVILKDRLPIKSPRQFHVLDVTPGAARQDWRALLPEGFTLRSVDAALLAETQLKNLDALKEEMCSERPSVEEFLEKSFGVCLVYGDETGDEIGGEIAGWCMSEYNLGDACEIGIETVAKYRRRGLATVMTLALVEQAVARGITHVGWHCGAANAASGATAHKAGFEQRPDYAVYMACFDEVDNLALHGNIAFERQDYQAALAWYERGLALGQGHAWVYWAAACAAAQVGRQAAAFECLSLALDRGFRNKWQLVSSPHLQSLRDRPEWKELLARLG